MTAIETNEDINIVAIWLRKDPVRWLSGALAGVFAGLAALAVAGILSGDIWFLARMAAVPCAGAQAFNFDAPGSTLVMGLVNQLGLCVFLGVLYAHFTGTNHVGALFGIGLTWGLFSWIFINNLFLPSFREIYALGINSAAALVVCLAFGLSLMSVRIFEGMIRRN